MTTFKPVTVIHIERTTKDAVVLTLEPEDGSEFTFTQGQYLTFRRSFDGEELRRSYSICTGVDDDVLQVAVKRVEGGVFSSWANTELETGDQIDTMPPMGQFYRAGTTTTTHYLLCAAGSGITPILSILKTGLLREPDARFTLVYGNRNPSTIMFRDVLDDLKNQYIQRLSVIHILSEGSADVALFQGRVDAAKCADLFDTLIDTRNISSAYICGPETMMDAVSHALKKAGLPDNAIRVERFTGNTPVPSNLRTHNSSKTDTGVDGQVTIHGDTYTLKIDANTCLLDAALRQQLDVPYACKAGICSTCKAKVLEGEVEMVANHALEDYEVEAGYVLTCQCLPLSKRVVWDYDQAGH